MDMMQHAWAGKSGNHSHSTGLTGSFLQGLRAGLQHLWTGGVLLLAISLPTLATAEPASVPGQLLVKPKPGVSETSFRSTLRNQGAVQVSAIEAIDVRVIKVAPQAYDRVRAALANNRNIEFAEPDYLFEPTLVPNDTYFSRQWHLPKVQAPAAWDLTTGNPGVTIAILDSGIDATHPELAGSLVPGWNFVDNNNKLTDVTGHGTSVAGVAAGAGNNGVGVAPLAWGCQIMPLRIADTNGYATLSRVASALTWAADRGARVANVSYGLSGASTLNTAAQYFQSKGGVITVSAGNTGTFDSAADNPYLLTISATDQSDVIASWSTTGNLVDLSAPGASILTTTVGGGYGSGTGTSFAAPLVAGVAALMLSANPDLSGPQVLELLKQTTDDLGTPGWDTTYGAGRVNALKAVQAAVNASPADVTPPQAQIVSPAPGNTVAGTVNVGVEATDDSQVARVDLDLNGSTVASSASSPAVFAWDTTKYVNGSYTLRARAIDAAGNVGSSANVGVTVQNVVPDTTAPTAQVTSPASGSTVAGTVNVGVSGADSVGVTKVEWYLNGALKGSSAGASASFAWNTTTVANGSYTLQAKAYDAAGNVGSSATVSVSVQNAAADTTPPSAAILSPATGAKVAKTVKVSVTSSDNVAVKRVDLLVDGKVYASSTSATVDFSWNTSKVSRGSHSLQAVAYDAAGNPGRSATVTVQK